MYARLLSVAAALLTPLVADAALVLEYIQVASITAGPSAGPTLSGPLVMDATGQVAPASVFLQVALRDTLGSGPNFGQPGTVQWQTNGGLAGPGSVGVGAFYANFQYVIGVAENPSSPSGSNIRLVDPVSYGTVVPPQFVFPPNRFVGGLLNFGYEPGAVPDPVSHRIALFNLRINAVGNGTGTFRLRDPNPAPTSVDNALLLDADPGGVPNAGTLFSIDDLLWGPNFTDTYDLPVSVVPEPTSLLLSGAALVGLIGRQRIRFALTSESRFMRTCGWSGRPCRLGVSGPQRRRPPEWPAASAADGLRGFARRFRRRQACPGSTRP